MFIQEAIWQGLQLDSMAINLYAMAKNPYPKYIWPEVFLTTKADGAFTKLAMRRTFSREGVPLTVVTDNGTHFTSSEVQYWLKSVGCRQVFSAPRHPESNGLAENFVKTLKNAVRAMAPASFQNLEQCSDSFLLQYRNAKHATTGENPSKLFKNRTLRTNLYNVSFADVTFFKGTRQEMAR